MTDGHPQNTVNVSTFIPEGFVFVPFLADTERDIAVRLIHAAGANYGAVMAQSGGFLVPAEVAQAAGLAETAVAAEAPVEVPAPIEVPAEAPVEVPAEAPVEAPVEPAPAPAPTKKAKAADATDAAS